MPNKTGDLGDEYGKLPLVTIGDSSFPKFSWLLNNFNCNTNDERERCYNKKMNSGRVVTENCYGMLKRSLANSLQKGRMKGFQS